jgi:Pretoxin HINT domain
VILRCDVARWFRSRNDDFRSAGLPSVCLLVTSALTLVLGPSLLRSASAPSFGSTGSSAPLKSVSSHDENGRRFGPVDCGPDRRACLSPIASEVRPSSCGYDVPVLLGVSHAGTATKPGTAISRACRTLNSFACDTEVLMADGSRKQISELKIGDLVVATDPETGISAARAVTAVHLNLDTALADLTVVDDDGDLSTINTTQHHPFWSVTGQAWTDVIDLQPGDQLRSNDGSLLSVVGVVSFVGEQWMWDLTVDEIHSFYVAKGDEPILVHNCIEGSDLGLLVKRWGKTTTDFDDVATRLATNSGISREVASKRLHTTKGGVENNQDVVFTRSCGVYDATSGDFLGSLIGG